MAYEFETTCVNSTAELIHDMQDNSEDLTHDEFAELLGNEKLNDWAQDMGYSVEEDGGLLLKDDWHVTYGKGEYGGRECIFIVHSAIEHIWLKENR